jgi:translation initiation factor 3 subunit E
MMRLKTKLTSEGNWSVAGLASAANINSEQIETYRSLAKYNFECGDYQASRDMLADYISLLASPPAPKNDEDEYTNTNQGNEKQNHNVGNKDMYYLKDVNEDLLQVLWGKLACEILIEDYKAAAIAVDATRTAMELLVANKELSSLKALEQRTWLLHWSLFVYWQVGGLEHLVDLCFSDRYKQAITTHAPHLLRYLTAAVLLCKRTDRRLLKSLIQVMQDCDYTDPIVEFVNCLCVKFDFDQAQLKLQECESVLKSDFFLCKQTALFMEEARVFVFENYCRIHNKIDLAALGDKLAMDQTEAERWIVDLIRNADFDAKIDADCVVMGASTQSVYEQVMERTRDLNVRSATLAQNLNNMLNEARKEKGKRERAAMED